MEDKITIIEGPPPIFEHVNDGWALGLNESPVKQYLLWLKGWTITKPEQMTGLGLIRS